jgi:hypothetical protein
MQHENRIRELAATHNWDRTYAGFSTQALREQRSFLEQQVFGLSESELSARFESGQVELLSSAGEYSGTGFDPLAVYWVRFCPDGKVLRADLPEDGFSDVFALKAESAWIAAEIRSRGEAP